MTELGDVIRAVRARLRMNTTQFGVLLGVNHSQVSRYELGRALPGYVPLGRLLQLAEGAEKNPILNRLAKLLGREKGGLTEAEAVAGLQQMNYHVQPLWNTVRHGPALSEPEHKWWELEFRRLMPNLADFMEGVDELCTRQLEIDSSLVQIVRLWLSHDASDAAIRECFADAARYLDVALIAKGSRRPGTPRARKETRLREPQK